MSSRLLPPGDPRAVEPMVWRTVGPEENGGARFLESLRAAGGGSEWERRIEQRIREAHAAGQREGEAAGQRSAAAAWQPAIERLGRSIEEISGLRARLRREAERDLVRLALAIARRILRRELAIDPDALHGLVLGALEKLRAQEIGHVRVHPAHEALVKACLERIITDSTVEVIADPTREPGAVIFETERGSLDASVESQLHEIERGLVDRLGKHP